MRPQFCLKKGSIVRNREAKKPSKKMRSEEQKQRSALGGSRETKKRDGGITKRQKGEEKREKPKVTATRQ